MFDIQEELKKLPDHPGVYLMHDARDVIIYIGKAVSLKNRVRQYFQSSRNKGPKIEKMVTHIARFEYILTDSELEALVLECNLIKEHRPKYNTMLKDEISEFAIFPEQKMNSVRMKNINSIVTSIELSGLFCFFHPLSDEEKECLMFSVQESIFKLDDFSFDDAVYYLYTPFNIKEEDFECTLSSLSDKLALLAQGAINYTSHILMTSHDENLIFSMKAIRAQLSRFEYELSSDTSKDKRVMMFYEFTSILKNSVLAVISAKSGISLKRLMEMLKTDGERWVSANGITANRKRNSKSEDKLLRAYKVPLKNISLFKLEEYLYYALTRQKIKEMKIKIFNRNT